MTVGEVAVWAGLVVVVAAAVSVGWRVLSRIVRTVDYLKAQVSANGLADDAGTKKQTLRDNSDAQSIMLATLGQAHERLEKNQRELGRRVSGFNVALAAHIKDHQPPTERHAHE